MGIELIDFRLWKGDKERASQTFDCAIPEINDYLIDKISLQDTERQERLILLADDDTIYGFTSLTIDTIKFISFEKGTYPVVKINAIGIDRNHQNKGYGTQLIIAAFQMALTANEVIPIDGIYLVALRDAVEFYEKFDIKNLNSPTEWFPSQQEYQMGIEVNSIKALGLSPYSDPIRMM